MRTICLLGSTGSIGESCLEVVRARPDLLRVGSLAARTNAKRVLEQAKEFHPSRVAIADAQAAASIESDLAALGIELLAGEGAVAALSSRPEADVVLNALVGAAGLLPTIRSLEAGVDVALANKESLVLGGTLVTETASKHGAKLLPVDSEHSALHQCLEAARGGDVRRVILTASGGPFLRHDAKALERVTPEEALRHPTWRMGPRITIDSATMLNKGFEVIEARSLFAIPVERIDVLVHPQSIVHAIVEMADGSCLAQMAAPDMRLPIQYALLYPERMHGPARRLDLARAGSLAFEEVDLARFPCLRLAYEAARVDGTAPAMLNAADEEAVGAFLARRIAFTDIARVIEGVLQAEPVHPAADVETILEADARARVRARAVIAGL